MNIQGYLIEKYNNMTNAYTCNRLVDEAKKLNINLKILGIHDTLATKEGIVNNGSLQEKRHFVINRYKWGKLKDSINTLGKRTYNLTAPYNTYINKYEQVKNLHSEEFLIPKYVLGTPNTNFEQLSKYLGTPFVAKGLESSMGIEIFLIKNIDDLSNLKEQFGNDKEWLFEEFISTSIGRDIRFYSIRGNVEACMIRKSQNDFRANVALGATVEKAEITPEISRIAKDIYNQTNLDFLGIDLMFGKDKPYFCEINVMPGIEGIETVTKVNVARKIIQTIKGDFDNE